MMQKESNYKMLRTMVHVNMTYISRVEVVLLFFAQLSGGNFGGDFFLFATGERTTRAKLSIAFSNGKCNEVEP